MKQLKYAKLTIWVLAIVLIGLYLHSMTLKNILNQIIESILIIVCYISIILISRLKTRLQIKAGLIKVYGERISTNAIVLINIGLGVVFIILGFITLNDVNRSILQITLGLCFIIAGFSNRLKYYIQITEGSVNKLDLDFIKIKDIQMIAIASEKITLKTSKRTMEIFYAEIKSSERQLIINDFEAIQIKNTLSKQRDDVQ